EAATDDDNLEPGDIYGAVPDIAGLRVLMTMSKCDAALVKWFHLAGSLSNVVHKPLQGVENLLHPGGPPQALGAVGPTQPTVDAFGGAAQFAQIAVEAGFNVSKMLGMTQRLILADLTPLHQYRVDHGLYSGGFAGSHSDINVPEIYHLVAGFFFGVAAATPIPAKYAPSAPLA
ncbi:MAG TPA: hypothetical protein VEV38_14565, partial [Candidatus Eremiobacteraceae bacterium]|nr:hypothetical protein [Candidatus Eremiobacteraceae bacterium]